jgi:hypothetical protein
VFLLILTGFSWNFPVFMDHKWGGGDAAERGEKIPQVLENDRKMGRMAENKGNIFITPLILGG